MNQQGNSFEEMLGMLTGGYEVLRNMEKVSTGLQTVTMRIAGMDETGDKLDPQIVSKMTDEFEKLAGISFVDTNGQIRDTYDILSDMAEIMPTLDKNTRQYLTELAAGKRQANVLQAILDNWSNVSKATQAATESFGSSTKEMEKYYDSIEGRTNALKSSLQELSTGILSDETVKSSLTLMTNIIKVVDEIGVLNLSLIGVAGAFASIGKAKSIEWMTSFTGVVGKATTSVSALTTTLLSNPLFLGAVGIVGALKVMDMLHVSTQEQEEKVRNLTSEYDKLSLQVDELRKINNPTDAEKTRLNILESQLDVQKQIIDAEKELLMLKELNGDSPFDGGVMGDSETSVMVSNGQVEAYKRRIEALSQVTEEQRNKNKQYYDDEARDLENLRRVMLSGADDLLSQKEKLTMALDMGVVTGAKADVVKKAIKDIDDALSGLGDVTGIDLLPTISDKDVSNLERASVSYKTLSERNEEYVNSFKDAKDKLKGYTDILAELNENNGLTAETISNITEKYPQLLAYMDDEDILRSKLIEIVQQQDSEMQDAYKNMLMTTDDFYKQKIVGDENLYNQLTSIVETYFNNLGIAYDGDLKNYQNLEQAKADTTAKLIQELAGAWSKYFSITTEGVGFNKNKFLKENPYASQEDLLEMERVYTEANAMQKKFADLAKGINIDPISITPYSSKKGSSNNKGDKPSDKFKQELEDIQLIREKIQREIDLVQEKMNLSELVGDTKEYDLLSDKMTDLLSQLKDVSEIQIGKFEGLAQLYKEQEKLGELEKLIADARKQDLIDEQTYMQHIIDLTNQKYDAEKRSYDAKVRDIELQQEFVKEGSEAHLALEQEKVDLLIQMQQSYLEKVRQLKESGLSQDQADVRKYVDMYYDAEMEILSMQKAMAEQAKAAKLEAISKQIEQYEEQKKAQQDIFDMTMKMIKAEHEARKKALQDEIKGYEKIINKKKEALRDEYDKENAADELAEKQKVLEDIEKQLLMLEGVEGEDAKAKRIKLEEEKAKAIKDIDKFNREQLLQGQEDMLDKELENFKDQKEEEIKEIDDYLSKEGNIRDEALKRMDKKNKALYEQLKKYSNEYTTMGVDELDKMWSTANQAIEGYTDKNLTLLDTMKLVTQELEKQKTLHNSTTNSPWQDNVPSGNAGGSQTNSNVKVIQQMMANSNKWTNATQEEKTRLADDNQRLGNSIGAYYENGVWYTDKTKKTKLYDSIIGVYHKGGIVGGNTSLKSSEEFAKLLKGEVVASIPQIDNFMNKTLPRIANGGGGNYSINLSIDKLIDVDKLDNNTDVESITRRAIEGVMKNLNNGFRNKGLRPSF